MSDSFGTIRLASVQAASVFLDRDATIAKACSLIVEAGRNGAQIIGFPEGFVPGHPIWYRHYLVGSPEDRRFYRALFANAVEIPSPATQALGDAARKANAYVVLGACERIHGTLGTLYNTLLFIGPDGSILGRHRKIMPTGAERLVHARGDGSDFRTYASPPTRIGGLICGEHTTSLARTALLVAGEQIHVAAWPPFTTASSTGPDAIDIRARMHAFEGRIFVISAAGVIDEDTIARLGLSDAQRGEIHSMGGHSGIINPRGAYIAGPIDEVETIIYADADLNEIVDGKLLQDVTGHYSRPDLFSFAVTPAPTVSANVDIHRSAVDQVSDMPAGQDDNGVSTLLRTQNGQ